MRGCPTIASRGREGKQVASYNPKEYIPKSKARFYSLWARESKSDENDNDVGK